LSREEFNKTEEFLPTKGLASPTCDLLHAREHLIS
jgi:hypothetical protein